MKHLSIILLLFLPLAFSSCWEDDELPPITTEGKHTFGCLVNGKLWLPEGRLGQSSIHLDIQSSGDTTGINLYASEHESGFTISIYDAPDIQINKPYDLATMRYYATYNNWSSGISYEYDNIISGSITLLRFDRGHIISGIFEFKAYDAERQDTVSVTLGRFDI